MNTVILDPLDPTTAVIGSYTDPVFGAVQDAEQGVIRNIHHVDACRGRACVIHNPSDHPLRSWRLLWRDDRKIFERICPAHGVGHPDPDQFEYWEETNQSWQAVHGCCLCCASS